jgi:hypothetical protein
MDISDCRWGKCSAGDMRVKYRRIWKGIDSKHETQDAKVCRMLVFVFVWEEIRLDFGAQLPAIGPNRLMCHPRV